jgi:hypothetical protein
MPKASFISCGEDSRRNKGELKADGKNRTDWVIGRKRITAKTQKTQRSAKKRRFAEKQRKVEG